MNYTKKDLYKGMRMLNTNDNEMYIHSFINNTYLNMMRDKQWDRPYEYTYEIILKYLNLGKYKLCEPLKRRLYEIY